MAQTRLRRYTENIKTLKANLARGGGKAEVCRMSTHVYNAMRAPVWILGMEVIHDPALPEGVLYIGPKENEEVKPNVKG
jgi:hypothetical protein